MVVSCWLKISSERITVRHHEACRVMPNSYPSDGIFNLYRRTIMDPFSCILFLRQLHLDLNMCCFINFTLKWLHFSIKKSSIRLLFFTLKSKRLAETDVKMTWRRQIWRQNVKIVILTSCTRFDLHPFTEIPFGYARSMISYIDPILYLA